MNNSLLFLLIALSLLVTGCATAPAHAPPPVDVMSAHEAHATALAACAKSISDIASSAGDATAKVVAVGAIERLCGSGQANMQAFAQQQQRIEPQSPWQAVWGATLAVADIALRGYGIRTQRDVAITQANTQAATTQASYAAFAGMGNTIGSTASNIAGAGFAALSKPGLPTTSITINGNGNNTGSGTQNTNSNNQTNTTTRTCTGGAGSNGGGGSSNAPGGGTTTPGGTAGAGSC